MSMSGRPKSAAARLTPPAPLAEPPKPKQGQLSSGAKKDRKRVNSARASNKMKNEDSKKVFPRSKDTGATIKERYRSQYNKDFEGSYIDPVEPRPTSPTRRNNPHPTQQFMVWRVPSREIGGRFQPERDDLMLPDQMSEFDDLESSYDRYKVPLPQPSSMDYGAYLRKMREEQRKAQQREAQQREAQQREWEQLGGDRVPSRHSQRGDGHQMSVGHDIMSRTLKDGKDGHLAEWLKTASPHEQQAVLKMLHEAENAQVGQTISDVMQPAAAHAVQNWMKKAGTEERDVAVRLFSSLGSRQGNRKVQRSRSEPSIRPPSRTMLPPAPPGNPSLVDQRLTTPTVDGKPWPKSLWHHLPVRDPPPRVYHRGSLFGKGGGATSHYTIHPEWPDYSQSTFNADAVH